MRIHLISFRNIGFGKVAFGKLAFRGSGLGKMYYPIEQNRWRKMKIEISSGNILGHETGTLQGNNILNRRNGQNIFFRHSVTNNIFHFKPSLASKKNRMKFRVIPFNFPNFSPPNLLPHSDLDVYEIGMLYWAPPSCRNQFASTLVLHCWYCSKLPVNYLRLDGGLTYLIKVLRYSQFSTENQEYDIANKFH